MQSSMERLDLLLRSDHGSFVELYKLSTDVLTHLVK